MSPQINIQAKQENSTFKRIGWGTNFLMISFAITIDVVQVLLELIPFVGWILSSALAGFGYFIVWFIWKLNGVSFWERKGGRYTTKLLLRFGGSAFLEMILSFVPALTVFVVTTNSLIQSEDKLVQEGFISREDVNRIGEILVERDVKNRKELLRVARREASKFAAKKIRKKVNQENQYINQEIRRVPKQPKPYQESVERNEKT